MNIDSPHLFPILSLFEHYLMGFILEKVVDLAAKNLSSLPVFVFL